MKVTDAINVVVVVVVVVIVVVVVVDELFSESLASKQGPVTSTRTNSGFTAAG